MLMLLAFATVYLIWGSTYLGIRYAIETLPPFLMAGIRFMTAGAILYGWSRWRASRTGNGRDGNGRGENGGEVITRSHWYVASILGFSLFLIGNGGVVWAESLIPSGLAALLVAVEPSWVVILNWLRPGGIRPSGKVLIGVLIGLTGVYFLIGGGIAGGHGVSLIGAAIVIGAAFSWAAGSLYSKHARLPASPPLSSGMQMLTGGGFLMLVSVLTGELGRFDPSSVSIRSGMALVYLILFGSIVAFTAYSWLLRVAPPVQAASYAYVNPVVAVILGWAIAGESIGVRTLIAAAVIITSVVLIITSQNNNKK